MDRIKKIGFTSKEYLKALKALLPKGPAWDLDNDDFMYKMLEIAALEFARIDNDILVLYNESDARYASYTIDDWFNQWGVPDECLKLLSDATIDLYRQVLVTKISTQGMSFYDLVKLVSSAVGFTDVELETVDFYDVNSTVDQRIYSSNWAQTCFSVSTNQTPVNYFLANDLANERLAEWGNELYECLVKSLIPCFATVIFQYGESESNY